MVKQSGGSRVRKTADDTRPKGRPELLLGVDLSSFVLYTTKLYRSDIQKDWFRGGEQIVVVRPNARDRT